DGKDLWQTSVPEAIEDGGKALAQGVAVDMAAAGDDAPAGGEDIADDAVAGSEDPGVEDAVPGVSDQSGGAGVEDDGVGELPGRDRAAARPRQSSKTADVRPQRLHTTSSHNVAEKAAGRGARRRKAIALSVAQALPVLEPAQLFRHRDAHVDVGPDRHT